jgi:hypothetical protein
MSKKFTGVNHWADEIECFTIIKEGDKLNDMFIHTIISIAPGYILFLDENASILFRDKLSVQGYTRPANIVEVLNAANECDAKVRLIFRGKRQRDVRYRFQKSIAEAFSVVLVDNEQYKSAISSIVNIQKMVIAEGHQNIRIVYIKSAFTATVVSLVILLAAWIFKEEIIEWLHSEYAVTLLYASLFGCLGAFISCFIKFRKYKGNIYVGAQIHRLDGLFRICYGLLAGLFAALAVKSNIIGGIFGQSNSGLMLIAMVAGISEYFVPSIAEILTNRVLQEKIPEEEQVPEDTNGIDDSKENNQPEKTVVITGPGTAQ